SRVMSMNTLGMLPGRSQAPMASSGHDVRRNPIVRLWHKAALTTGWMHVRCLKEEQKSNVRCPLERCGSHFLGSNITYKAAKAGRMRQSLEIGIPLFLGKGETGLRITSLRRLVADQKGDRRSAK